MLWENLINLSQGITQPWVLLGDLNVVLNSTEKVVEAGELPAVSTELQEFLGASGLEDLRYYGQRFTWTNHHTWCKLDRVLVNEMWLDKLKDSYAQFEAFGVSDHSPMVVTISPQVNQLRIPFRFKNIWVQDPGYEELLREVWDAPIYGRHMYILCRRLKLLKGKLKAMNLNSYSNLSMRVDKAREALQLAQQTLELDPYDVEKRRAKSEAMDTFRSLNSLWSAQLLQQSKASWAVDGDRNSRYFHALVRKRRNAKHIHTLQTGDGEWVTDPDQITQHILQFYQKLLGEAVDCRPVDIGLSLIHI